MVFQIRAHNARATNCRRTLPADSWLRSRGWLVNELPSRTSGWPAGSAPAPAACSRGAARRVLLRNDSPTTRHARRKRYSSLTLVAGFSRILPDRGACLVSCAYTNTSLTPKPCLLPFGNKRKCDRVCQRRSTASGCVRRHYKCHYPLAAQQALSNAPLATSRAHGVDLWQLICVQDKRTTLRRPHEGHVEDEPGRHCHAPGKLQHDPTGRDYS